MSEISDHRNSSSNELVFPHPFLACAKHHLKLGSFFKGDVGKEETKLSHEAAEMEEHVGKLRNLSVPSVAKCFPFSSEFDHEASGAACLDTPTIKTTAKSGVWKTVHFVRHGQGEHNVLAAKVGGCSCSGRSGGLDVSQCVYKTEKILDAR